MLKKFFAITRDDNRIFYETEHGKDIDEINTSLLQHGVFTQIIYSPQQLKQEWLEPDSLVITDDYEYVETFLNVRANVVFFLNERNKSNIPWGVDYILDSFDAITYDNLEDAYISVTNSPRIILETERLILRESTVDDVDEFYRIYSEQGITDYTENLFEDPDDEKRYMSSYIREIYGFYGFGIWTVILKETGEIIGRAGVTRRDGYDDLELGYIIEKRHQQKGLATEICKAILTYAQRELNVNAMQALTEAPNIASEALLQTLGFKYEREVKENGKIYQLFRLKL